jgi:hypothetical protein
VIIGEGTKRFAEFFTVMPKYNFDEAKAILNGIQW